MATMADPILELEVLPADEGDCLLLSCHTADGPRHVLIDGGTAATAPRLKARLQQLPGQRLELLVVTHIDADHIAGMVRLLRDPELALDIGEAWFNGLRHLPAKPGTRGPADGERLSDLLTGKAGGPAIPWNTAFGGRAVQRADDDPKTGETTAALPVIRLPWGLSLTVLSPTPRRLGALRANWDGWLAQLRREEPNDQPLPRIAARRGEVSLDALAATPTANDTAVPNGSSIALLAEFGGRSLLLGADAFPTVLYPALLRLARQRAGLPAGTPPAQVPPLVLDVVKLPHHGSRANVALALFDVLRAEHYIVSTSGARFGHPDEEAMARVITRGRSKPGAPLALWFNHVSATTAPWRDAALAAEHIYQVKGAATTEAPGALIRLAAR